MRQTIALIALCFAFKSAASTDITLTSSDGFTIHGSYFSGKEDSNKALLMLHQCNFNRSMYNDIGNQLSQQGIHALSIDFRGYGDSKNNQFDVSSIRKLSGQSRTDAWRDMVKYWPQDVQLAYEYLRRKVSNTGQIGVIGASCGGTQAITLANNSNIDAIGFFSSAQTYDNIQKYVANLSSKPTLIIAADDDGRTYTSANILFKEAKHANSKLLTYKGKLHGYPLLEHDKNLNNAISHWFGQQLKK
ncbi:alpha/beta hydrolase [Pseudoalteromonas luteoviolacea]|uniref:Serine aminopeptidase S33 domain-containing protein n=1 Tax=Pseudoalteromonas luteoviolacea H33 TaxID=1365251 RepID=A0A167DQC9_9GAMM|nr:alpha/beta hydrolase [Pseudoalteromonas luteoviolacea]KZN49197.1 hypothetical protein N476_20380 [Pseudoalteromonas luteoviolacea H33]KZN73627.1 hypothetical protein N477_23280 [Pseudoalteromonas luteoviolacea H33-S]